MQAFLTGFSLGLGLIVAIGAQNAFVLRQGLRREHVLAVCLVCILSDALLISAGVAGFALAAGSAPWLVPLFRWGGVAFLLWYGLQNARTALRGGNALEAARHPAGGRRRAILTALALTWLNPHVWLDTVVLLGSLAAAQESRLAFALGAIAASAIFFLALGYGARLAQPLFARPAAWRVLDALVALTMWAIALSLVIADPPAVQANPAMQARPAPATGPAQQTGPAPATGPAPDTAPPQ